MYRWPRLVLTVFLSGGPDPLSLCKSSNKKKLTTMLCASLCHCSLKPLCFGQSVAFIKHRCTPSAVSDSDDQERLDNSLCISRSVYELKLRGRGLT